MLRQQISLQQLQLRWRAQGWSTSLGVGGSPWELWAAPSLRLPVWQELAWSHSSPHLQVVAASAAETPQGPAAGGASDAYAGLAHLPLDSRCIVTPRPFHAIDVAL